jgi:2-polyprenyl-3-methyl-5-hydroxy-6-metoxy-1,4-benzoquinol methylase
MNLVVIDGGSIISACADCEHIFFRRRPSPAWLEHYYSTDWDRVGRENAGPSRPRPDTKVLKFCDGHLTKGARILDCGAGFGTEILPFKEAGYAAHGIERSEHRANFLRDTLGIPCAKTAIEDFADERGFDLIFMNHVFEHVSDPRQVLSHIARLLVPNGLVYLAVPNQVCEHAPKSVHTIAHLHWFSLRSLTSILMRSGFEVVCVTETPTELQILGRRASTGTLVPQPKTPTQREAYLGEVRRRIAQSFGEGLGARTIICCKTKGSHSRWEQRIVRDTVLTPFALRFVLLCLERLPKKLSKRLAERVFPCLLSRFYCDFIASKQSAVMILRFIQTAECAPLRVCHKDKAAVVWVK